jgi:anhydro-N-acetylmuramic acid kinase
MAWIGERLPGVELTTIDAYGVAEAAKEALIFALVGFLTVHGLPGAIPSCTGAAHASVLGTVAPGARPLTLTPGARAPERLLVRTPLAGRARLRETG